MKRNAFRSIVAAGMVLLFAMSASASCPTVYGGPYVAWWGSWYVYDVGQSCYTVSGSASKVSLICGNPGFVFGSGSGQAQTSFTLTSSHPILNPARWNIGTNIIASSPGGTSADRVEIDINVQHPNGTTSYYTNYYWSGVNGSLSCHLTNSYFTANTGDTIYIIIAASNSGGATIQVEVPTLTNNSV